MHRYLLASPLASGAEPPKLAVPLRLIAKAKYAVSDPIVHGVWVLFNTNYGFLDEKPCLGI